MVDAAKSPTVTILRERYEKYIAFELAFNMMQVIDPDKIPQHVVDAAILAWHEKPGPGQMRRAVARAIQVFTSDIEPVVTEPVVDEKGRTVGRRLLNPVAVVKDHMEHLDDKDRGTKRDEGKVGRTDEA
jgi:hypothetical protein